MRSPRWRRPRSLSLALRTRRRAAIDDFIGRHLSERNFDEYLADPARELLLAEVGGEAAGYTMIVHGEPSDPDVAASVTVTPTIELSKLYVLEVVGSKRFLVGDNWEDDFVRELVL